MLRLTFPSSGRSITYAGLTYTTPGGPLVVRMPATPGTGGMAGGAAVSLGTQAAARR